MMSLKTYGTLKMFLLSAQNNFYVILSSYVDRRASERKSTLSFMSLVGFQFAKF